MDGLIGALPAHLTDNKPEEIKAKNALQKDDFMRLLLVQLQNQDPLNPMDHKEFSAQLAQFGSLEQLTNIGKGIDKMQAGMGGEAKLQAVGMIGKSIQASGKEATLVAGEPMNLKLDSSENGRPVKVSIFDGEGKLIREMPINSRKEESEVVWDGKTNDGIAAPEGKYTFKVAAVGTDGKTKEMDPSVKGEVVGVELEGASPILLIKTKSGKTRIQIDQIQNVSDVDKKAAAGPARPEAAAMRPPEIPEMLKRSLPIAQADGGIQEGSDTDMGASSSWHSDPFTNSGITRGWGR